MIPEFKFKRKTPIQKKAEIKELLGDKRVRITGAAVAGVAVLGLAVLAVPNKETTKKQNDTFYMQTAGVATQIYTAENTIEEQMKKSSASISKNEDAAMTSISLDAAAGFDTELLSNESVEEEIAAEAASEAVVAAATQEAVAAEEEAIEPEQPVHPQLVGFSNPGIANVEQFVNIRTAPREDAEICGKLSKNAACEVLADAGGWYEVVTGGVHGYIKSEYLITGEDAWTLADQLKYAYVRVLTETLYVREAPSTESKILGMVSIDQQIMISELQDEWVKVQMGDKDGYLNKSYIAVEYTLPRGEAVEKKESSSSKKSDKDSKNSKSDKSESSSKKSSNNSSVVSYATQFVGNPYVYGGTSLTKGADCSGFTMSVYAKFGVYLPHSSAAQSKCGTKVSTSELQPGDLIFYGSGSSVNHVALYIGGGKIVHASTEKTGIKISNAFYRTPVTCRRVK